MAKTTTKAPAKPRRSKVEVQDEFETLQEQAAASPTPDAKTASVVAAREEDVRAAVAEVGIEAVVQRIASLGLDVSRSLTEVSEKLTAEVRLLATLREAVTIERRELERLHQIDVAATALDHQLADHAERKAAFDREMEEAQADWEADTARTDRERREQEDTLKRQRQRETEDYEYRKAQERKKAQDKVDEEQRQQERRNTEKQETLERDWARRETALKEREARSDALESEIAGFPAKLTAATEAAAKAAREQSEARLERDRLLLQKDAEADARMAELRVKTLEQSLATQAAHAATLERQLAEAKAQVQEIAVRAIDGASGARALGHINQIAMEQAKHRPPG
jgi:colicin import membrane protein